MVAYNKGALLDAEQIRQNMERGAGGQGLSPIAPTQDMYGRNLMPSPTPQQQAQTSALLENPNDLGFFELIKQAALQNSGLLGAYNKQQQDIQGKEKIRNLIGSMRGEVGQQQVTQAQDVDPVTGEPYTYERSVLPTTVTGSEALAADPRNISKMYGDMLTTPGYEQMGAQGLQGLIGSIDATRTAGAKAKDKAAKDAFDREQKLRDEFSKETKGFIDINDAYGRIQSSASDPSPAGDLSMIFNYMKMLDPGSVVRESEFATAQNAASVPEKVRSIWNRALTGEKLTPTQRADFTNRAGKLYNEALTGFGKRKATFEKLAESYQLDPTKVTFTRGLYDPYKPSPETTKLLGAYRGETPPPQGIQTLPPGAVKRK